MRSVAKSSWRSRPPCRAWLLLGLVPLFGGCATLRATVDGWGEDASGLSRAQRTLRTALADSDFPVALAWKEDDAVLHALTGGISAYYAAQYARSAALLDTAALLADARLTTSVSRAALTLVTNDLARAYEPRRTERLFVPYYAMLSYTQLGQWEEAAVEARRLSALLAQHARDADDGERTLHGMMHYLAGAVFDRAGEQQAAAVAYRNARALVPAFAGPVQRAGGGTGDVVVILERGFVAHRVTETLHLNTSPTCERSHPPCERPHGRHRDQRAEVASSTPAAGLPAFRQRDVVAAPARAGQAEPTGSRPDTPSWGRLRGS